MVSLLLFLLVGFDRGAFAEEEQGIKGGEEKNFTAGLNWHLNPNARITFNYIFAHVEDSNAGTQFLRESDTNIFQMRFQIDF